MIFTVFLQNQVIATPFSVVHWARPHDRAGTRAQDVVIGINCALSTNQFDIFHVHISSNAEDQVSQSPVYF
jgi:hypothetical protein